MKENKNKKVKNWRKAVKAYAGKKCKKTPQRKAGFQANKGKNEGRNEERKDEKERKRQNK